MIEWIVATMRDARTRDDSNFVGGADGSRLGLTRKPPIPLLPARTERVLKKFIPTEETTLSWNSRLENLKNKK